jgi:hypothetical protein
MDRKTPALAAFLIAAAGATHAEHPLVTDDINTQGRGGWQLELNGERRQAAAVASYGVRDDVDVQLGVPWEDNGAATGVGDVALDVKWRLYESGPLKAGIKPGVTFPSGRSEDGLGSGRMTWGAIGVITYDAGRAELLANVAYRHNRNTADERKDLARVSAAVLPKVTKALRLALDLAYETNPDPAADGWVRHAVVGFIYSVNKDFDFDAGYRRSSDPAIDRRYLLGVTFRW